MAAEAEMLRILSIISAVLLISSAPAHADWEWTRWGMSPGQVLAASQGTAVSATAEEKHRRTYRRGFIPIRVPQLVVQHRLNGVDVLAYFLFDVDTARLVCVDLIPKAGEVLPADLRASLVSTLGAPVQEKRQQLPGLAWTTTTWTTDSDKIELQQGSLGAKLQYCQRDQGQVASR